MILSLNRNDFLDTKILIYWSSTIDQHLVYFEFYEKGKKKVETLL